MKKRILWSTLGGLILISAAQQTAYGLDFPMTSTATLDGTKSVTVDLENAVDLQDSGLLAAQLDNSSSLFASQMALVASVSRQVELARTPIGAKKVAKAIAASEFNWGDDQYTCLNRLWTKESHWNYKAHNYRSGAHGIAQALPASKMEVIGADWRTNPVTQIRWGLRYIDIRYDNPCKAWAKWKSHRYY